MKYVASAIQLTEGAEELIRLLKQAGYKIAIVSGGFTYFTDILKENLGLDYVFANTLEIKNNQISGELQRQI